MGNNNWNSWRNRWASLTNATYYLDPIFGNDVNSGLSPTLAWQTYAKAENKVLTAGQSIYKKVDSEWIPFRSCTSATTSGWTFGYYEDGQGTTIAPANLDFSGLTHIAHSRVEPNTDGSLNTTVCTLTTGASSTLITAAHAAGVKVLLTVADITNKNMVAAVTNNLETLVSNIVQMVVARGYDGVDIDWETGGTTDTMTGFMAALYPAIKSQNPNLLVTMAITPSPASDGSAVWLKAVDFCDKFTIMTYGSYLTGGKVTWFNCPMYDGNYYTFWGLNEKSCNRDINGFLSLGIPASKMMLGVPFYGMLYSGNIGAPTSGPLAPRQAYTANFATETYLPYNQVPPYYVNTADHWDDLAQSPYMSLSNADPTLNKYLSYDDPSSILSKVNYVQAKGLGGIAIWDISLDYFSGRTNIKSPLLTTIKNSYPKQSISGITPDTPQNLTVASVTTSSATVNWPVVANATSYNVKRSTTNGSGYSTIASVIAPGYTNSGLTSGVTYYYVVSAVNNGVEGANSAQLAVTATALAAPTNLLTSPADITNAAWTVSGTGASKTNATTMHTASTGGTSLSQTVTVTANTDYVATIILTPTSGTASYTSFAIYTPSFNTLSVSTQQLSLNSPTSYSVAFNSGSNASVIFEVDYNSDNVSANITIASAALVAAAGTYITAAPQNVTASAVAATNMLGRFAINLGWSWVAGATNYVIKRSVSTSAQNYVVIGSTSGSTFTDDTLTAGAKYYYVVTAVHGAIESANSSQVSGTAASTYAPPNSVVSPTDLTNAAWEIVGSGAAASGGSALLCATSGDTFLQQTGIPVAPNSNYTATIGIASPNIGCWCTVTIYDPTFTVQLASLGQWVDVGPISSWRLPFDTGTNSSVVMLLDVNPGANGQTINLTDVGIAMTTSIPANIITASTDITSSVWTVTGTTGGALQFTAPGSGTSGISQQSIAVTPNTDYIATLSIKRSDTGFVEGAGGYSAFTVLGAGWTESLGLMVTALVPGQDADQYILFNSGSYTSVVFLLTVTAEAAGKTIQVHNISIAQNPYGKAAITTPVISVPTYASLSSVSMASGSVIGGTSVVGTVTLNQPAQAGGVVVFLSTNSAKAGVFGSVMIPAGSTSVAFAVGTSSVSSLTAITVTATYGGATKTAALNISPAASLAGVSVSPTTVAGGSPATGTVTLNATSASPITVTLSSDNGSVVVPASVVVSAGSTTATFAVTTSSVGGTIASTITASYSGVSQTAPLTLTASASLTSVSVSPTSLTGGSSSTGTVTLNAAAGVGGAVVSLSSNSGSATVPASVTVAQGSTTATFTVTTTAVGVNTTATITATYNATVKTAALGLTPVTTVSSVVMSPASVVGGSSSTGTVTLTQAAPTGGLTVTLVDNSASSVTPASVTVAAGSTTATFTVTSSTVATNTVVTITATLNSVNATSTLTLTSAPVTVSSITTSVASAFDGVTSAATGTVTLSGNAPTGGVVVALTSNQTVATVPASVTVAAGAKTATFAINTVTTGTSVSATITGTYASSSANSAFVVLSKAQQAAQIYNDGQGLNEAHPHGVPSTWDWYSAPSPGWGNDSHTWGFIEAWGQVYCSLPGTTTTNTRVNIRNQRLYYIKNSTKQWVLLQQNNTTTNGAFYYEDFSNDAAFAADVRQEADGTISCKPYDPPGQAEGYLFHFYPANRAAIPASDIYGIVSIFEGRLILDSATGTDDRAAARFIANGGADYYNTLSGPLPASYNGVSPPVNVGKMKYVPHTAPYSWRTFCMTTMSQADLTTYPPPLNLFGLLP